MITNMKYESEKARGERLYKELCEKKGGKITIVDLYKFYNENVITEDDISIVNKYMVLAGL